MARIDIRDIDDYDIEWIKKKCAILGKISRSDYIRLLIKFVVVKHYCNTLTQ